MFIEINQAVEFIGRLLQSKVETEVIVKLKEELIEILKDKFQEHWDPQQPYRGNGYRSISNFNEQTDSIIEKACHKASCSVKLIHSHLPRDFVLWIDPFSVSYRVGDHGNIMTLYEDRSMGSTTIQHGMMSPVQSPKIHYTQPQSIPIRMSPPNSPENKKIIKSHLHQSSPLAIHAKKDKKKDVIV